MSTLTEKKNISSISINEQACSVCLDTSSLVNEINAGVVCSEGHFTCSHCLNLHVVAQCGSDPSHPDFAHLHDTRRGEDIAGFRCPHFAARQCSGPVLAFKELACFPLITQDTFAKACEFVHALREHEKISRLQASENELSTYQLQQLFPENAYQCTRCGLGPVLHRACEDLSAHHGNTVGKTGIVSNACQGCGWFSAKLKDWTKWDPANHQHHPSPSVLRSSEVERTVAEVNNATPPKSATWLHQVKPFFMEIDPPSSRVGDDSNYVAAIVKVIEIGIGDHSVVSAALRVLKIYGTRHCLVQHANVITAVVRCLVALGEDYPKVAANGFSILSDIIGTLRRKKVSRELLRCIDAAKNTVRRAGGIRAIMCILAKASALTHLQRDMVIDKGCQALLSLARGNNFNHVAILNSEAGFNALRAARIHQLPRLASQANAIFDLLSQTFLQRITEKNLAKLKPSRDENEFYLGQSLTIRWKSMRGAFYAGRIVTRNENGNYCVAFDDGDMDFNVPPGRMRASMRDVIDDSQVTATITAVLSVLREVGEKLPKVAVRCCSILEELARPDVANCANICKMGGISATVQCLMMLGETEAKVAKHACGALCNIIHGIEAHQNAVRVSGGINAVVSCMVALGETDIGVAQYGCLALQALAHGEHTMNQDAICAADGLSVIVRCLVSHVNDRKVLHWGFVALNYIAEGNSANKRAILSCGGIDAIVVGLQVHAHDSWNVALWGCLVLMKLAHKDPVVKTAIRRARGPSAVTRAMLNHRSNVKFTTTVRHELRQYNIQCSDSSLWGAQWWILQTVRKLFFSKGDISKIDL